MADVHEVRLELVRPGPPHNQLLSPLTPYIALCGDGSPITFHIDLEHRQLLNRIERLRYLTPDGRGGYEAVPDRLREDAVRELGEEMGKVLARIPSLNAELLRACSSSARDGEPEFVHVRLILSGSELSVIPFELARSPQSFPGEGLDLCLQGSLPVVVTREIRRSRSLPVSWGADREPKVLFVSAEPGGLKVPKIEHLRSLRRHLEPWIGWPKDETLDRDLLALEKRRLPLVKERLRVLADASIEAIYEMCAAEAFTHVHILAHGDRYEEGGEQRFGVALCRQRRPEEKEVVSGEQLAKALRAEDARGASRSEPLVVTLATCDAGQQGSVLVPGGSIAHDLHAAGIPWVFASQFPLTKGGSVRIVEFLYPRLLRGDDPRQVLYELRRRLSMSGSRDHDWASLVTYTSLEPNFDEEVATFFERQTKKAIDVQMARADNLIRPDGDTAREARVSVDQALRTARDRLRDWAERLPTGKTMEERKTRASCFGITGATYKRMGLLHAALGENDEAKAELRMSHAAYRKAMEEWVTEDARFNWTASQYLALSAVLGSEKDPGTYTVCRQVAERDLSDPDRELQAWAHGTLAELELIGLFHQGDRVPDEAKAEVVRHCRAMVQLMGLDSFHVQSTRRQFQRYAEGWRLEGEQRPAGWTEIAQAAVKALTPNGSEDTAPE